MGDNTRREPTALLRREAIGASLLADEAELVGTLIETARFSEAQRVEIDKLATRLVEAAREGRGETGGVDSFLHEYGLSNEEGVLLLCLAEALLRIPDAATADRLIAGTVSGTGQPSEVRFVARQHRPSR
jgi:RHH-type proline utilization regulon transcriptional repressor/proline dehydrogenase/delta 1-pyrroline-5-carboxylate dehydrogenase